MRTSEQITTKGDPAVLQRLVLVVDDEPLVTLGLREELESLGLGVEVAESLRDALRSFRYEQHRLCAMVVDVGLPDGSGLELVRRVRTVDAELPIVLITGFSHSTVGSMLDGDRHLEIIEKPFDYADLETTLQSLGVHIGVI